MADSTRFELATSAVTVRRSNQLSYESIFSKCPGSILKNICYANFFLTFFNKNIIIFKIKSIQSLYFKYFFEDKYHANHQIKTNIIISIIEINKLILNSYKFQNDEFKFFNTIRKIKKLKTKAINE